MAGAAALAKAGRQARRSRPQRAFDEHLLDQTAPAGAMTTGAAPSRARGPPSAPGTGSATFDPAMSRTSAASTARIQSGRSNCSAQRGRAVGSPTGHRAGCARLAGNALGRAPRARRLARAGAVKAAWITLCACSIADAGIDPSEDAGPLPKLGSRRPALHIMLGNHTSVGRPGSTPGETCLGHADDLKGRSSSVSHRPTTRRSPPKRRIQNAWLDDDRGALQGRRSSCGAEQTSGRRHHAEPIERVAGHVLRTHLLFLAGGGRR